MEERVGKLFQITEEKSGRTCMLGFEQYKSFEQRCKHKFGYPDDLNVTFEIEGENVEIDKTAIMFYPNNTKFRMRPVPGGSEKHGSNITKDAGVLSGNPGTKPSDQLRDRFSVIVEESPLARKCNIVGRMDVFIGSTDEIVFEHAHTRHVKYSFKLAWIRRFGSSGECILSLEIGRRCPNGEGDVFITTRDAKTIHHLLHKKCNSKIVVPH